VAVNGDLGRLVEGFAGLRVLVIGEAMVDSYLDGPSERLCQEAPVPIVAVRARRDAPGGAANTAVNAAALGGTVRLLTVVGDDREARVLRRGLADAGVDGGGVIEQAGRRTLAKQRVMAGGHLLVRIDEGSTGRVSASAERLLVDRVRAGMADADAVIVSDYGYGVLTPRVIAALAEMQARAPRTLVVDSKTLTAYRAVGVSAIKPNYGEAMRLLGLKTGRREERAATIGRRGHRLLEAAGARIAAVSLDTEGALFFERGRPPYRTYARPTAHTRAAGAGDTFVAALALALAAGGDMPAAAELASAAAGVVVTKDGTAACAAAELRGHVAGAAKVTDLATLGPQLERHRADGRRIVLTNGCFDILHRGHVTYLSAAKAEGDVLVVGLNSDDSVRRLKGPGRPVNGVEDRAQVLAALSSVDYVVSFDEDTPVALVGAVRPDVFVKGGDYTLGMLPEAPVVEALGGTVRILPYVDERSTTRIIARIRRQPTAERVA
jgi:D-beta-D-heptose 7-phosphate kinase/D-beta-D-heptose 1-phosphate adenosyltransferase